MLKEGIEDHNYERILVKGEDLHVHSNINVDDSDKEMLSLSHKHQMHSFQKCIKLVHFLPPSLITAKYDQWVISDSNINLIINLYDI